MQKGWTAGEIGVAWIKEFDCLTKVKAASRWRLLLVDGHNSHYTQAFLDYTRMNQIIVLCYPSHATHIYQGLDVVVFSVLKRYVREEHDNYECTTATKFSKSNFLQIYRHAHLRALIPEIIESAFRKTGVWPFNPNLVTPKMMAPSKVTSVESHLPVVPPTPVCIIASLIRKVTISEPITKNEQETLDWDSVGEDFTEKLAALDLEGGVCPDEDEEVGGRVARAGAGEGN